MATSSAPAAAGPSPSSTTIILRDEFERFFNRPDSFGLGVCNGCQMLSRLRSIIPGGRPAGPDFERNRSEQFESRVVMVEITDSPSLFFRDMAGSRLPIVVAHGEGRAVFNGGEQPGRAALRFIDNARRGGGNLPVQPKRIGPGNDRFYQRRRAVYHHDAAPGAGIPGAAGVLGRARPSPAPTAPGCKCSIMQGNGLIEKPNFQHYSESIQESNFLFYLPQSNTENTEVFGVRLPRLNQSFPE